MNVLWFIHFHCCELICLMTALQFIRSPGDGHMDYFHCCLFRKLYRLTSPFFLSFLSLSLPLSSPSLSFSLFLPSFLPLSFFPFFLFSRSLSLLFALNLLDHVSFSRGWEGEQHYRYTKTSGRELSSFRGIFNLST